jgi:hypothetical protein
MVLSMTEQQEVAQNEAVFTEFRRKVKEGEVLSASLQRLLLTLNFTGKVSVIVQNGRILKSGYEEGYFRQS